MTRAELKAMKVRITGSIRVCGYYGDWKVEMWNEPWGEMHYVRVAGHFPTRAKAEQYARQLRRAIRGEKP